MRLQSWPQDHIASEENFSAGSGHQLCGAFTSRCLSWPSVSGRMSGPSEPELTFA